MGFISLSRNPAGPGGADLWFRLGVVVVVDEEAAGGSAPTWERRVRSTEGALGGLQGG